MDAVDLCFVLRNWPLDRILKSASSHCDQKCWSHEQFSCTPTDIYNSWKRHYKTSTSAPIRNNVSFMKL